MKPYKTLAVSYTHLVDFPAVFPARRTVWRRQTSRPVAPGGEPFPEGAHRLPVGRHGGDCLLSKLDGPERFACGFRRAFLRQRLYGALADPAVFLGDETACFRAGASNDYGAVFPDAGRLHHPFACDHRHSKSLCVGASSRFSASLHMFVGAFRAWRVRVVQNSHFEGYDTP